MQVSLLCPVPAREIPRSHSLKDMTPALWFPPGGWKLWSLWGECTRDCGGGLQTRTRSCLPSPGIEGGGCEGVLEEGRLCNRKACGSECAARGGRGGRGLGLGPVLANPRMGPGQVRKGFRWSGGGGRNPRLAKSGEEGGPLGWHGRRGGVEAERKESPGTSLRREGAGPGL